jgi:hypothetical protein
VLGNAEVNKPHKINLLASLLKNKLVY